MERLVIQGGKRLKGEVTVSGAKNVALKALVGACLTDREVIIENIPLISDFFVMVDIIKELGGSVKIQGHTAWVCVKNFKKSKISLEKAATVRTSVMFLAPLLARAGRATIPNPGGCRIGARPIDRIVDGLKMMGVHIVYHREDGYFQADCKRLKRVKYRFEKNTHTGTETLILASVLASGSTVLTNAAQEPEIDDLIFFLNSMGAKIKRTSARTIKIMGVSKLHGTRFRIGPDRNEAVTFAIASLITDGDVLVKGVRKDELREFLEKLDVIGARFEERENGLRFYLNGGLESTNVVTSPYPGFMTDWQGPWAVLMTRSKGVSTIHETIYESRFGYILELRKMGAKISFFNPKVRNPKTFYNFNFEDDSKENFHAVKIYGPVHLHNAVVNISDLRAGATLVLAALAAKGETIIFGVEYLDRGYESFDRRLKKLGAGIRRLNGE